MGLFDVFKKKDCEICGKEVGLLGYKKLQDGEICKDCVKLLSPWFEERRESTVAQIKEIAGDYFLGETIGEPGSAYAGKLPGYYINGHPPMLPQNAPDMEEAQDAAE